MKAAVTHEVPDELGQLWRDRVRYLESVIPRVVRLIKNRQRHPARSTGEYTHLQWDDVARGQVGKTLPCPVPCIWLDDLDPVCQRALYLIATLGLDAAGGLFSVDEELAGAARPFVGRDGEVQFLPAVPIFIAKFGEAGQPAIRRHKGVTGEAAGGRQQRCLCVAVPI